MNKFKIGDTVKRNNKYKGKSLTKKNTNYKVLAVDEDGNIELEGFSDNLFDYNNFDLVAKVKKRMADGLLTGLKQIAESDEIRFINLLKDFGMELQMFKNKKMLFDEAIKDNAVIAYDLIVDESSTLTFNFNKNGRFVGVNTIYVNGYESRKNK